MSETPKKSFKFFIILFVFTFLVKLLLALYFADIGRCSAANDSLTQIFVVGKISFAGGDTFSYLEPVNNFIETNKYFVWNGKRDVFAGRMPYYGTVYFLLRLFFEKSLAADLLVALQIFLSSAAAICFACLCFNSTKKKWCYWIGYALYLLSFNSFALDLVLIPESFPLSLTVFFLYFCQRFQVDKTAKMFYSASIFLAFLTLLKPYFVLLYPFFYLEFVFINKIFTSPINTEGLKNFFRKTILSGLILVALLLPWAARNYINSGKLIFSQEDAYAGYDYAESELAFRRFTAAWGGDLVWRNPQTPNPSVYFLKEHSSVHDQIKLPAQMFAEGYGIEDVERVRIDFLQLQNQFLPEADASVAAQFDRLTAIYKAERPLMYYFGSGFIAAKRLVFHTNSEFLMAFLSPNSICFRNWQNIFRIFNALIYLFSLFLGLAGIFIFAIKKKISIMFLIFPFFLILYFAFYDGFASARYFLPACPALLFGTVLILKYFGEILPGLNRNKN